MTTPINNEELRKAIERAEWSISNKYTVETGYLKTILSAAKRLLDEGEKPKCDVCGMELVFHGPTCSYSGAQSPLDTLADVLSDPVASQRADTIVLREKLQCADRRIADLITERNEQAQAEQMLECGLTDLRQQLDAERENHKAELEVWKTGCVGLADDIAQKRSTIASLTTANQRLREALEECDKAFANWQVGQIPGRPEDILALISKVRSALSQTPEATDEGNEVECDHAWRWIDDWTGDPEVIGGTQDCSRWECQKCGQEDYDREPPIYVD